MRAAIIEKLRTRARPRMAEMARQGGWISGGWAEAIEHPELLKMRAQRDQLKAMREQGIPKLGPAICWLTDQMLPLQAWGGDEMWLDQIYGSLLRDSGTLAKASDDLLRPVFLHVVIEVVYQGSPEAFIVRLR